LRDHRNPRRIRASFAVDAPGGGRRRFRAFHGRQRDASREAFRHDGARDRGRRFRIDAKVPLSLVDDSPVGTARSAALALEGFAKVFKRLKPDLVVILGDRFEALAAAEAALFTKIPVAHIAGGERTDGAYDDALRHAITKMSHLHFAATESYARRIVQLGEDPRFVFDVGAMAVDSIATAKLLSKKELEAFLGRPFARRNYLITFHPATADAGSPKAQFKELLKALERRRDAFSIFTMPNADTGSRGVAELLERHVETHRDSAALFVALGRIRYRAARKYVDAGVGTSSRGRGEAPSFRTPTINIGSRQGGRIRAASVIDCAADEASISKAFQKLDSREFKDSLKTVRSPFGRPGVAKRILSIVKRVDLKAALDKRFHDLP
jgi:GDP/UDP-N,N'-diacetylbacillosamine 2-epimerase (hydrolysing)